MAGSGSDITEDPGAAAGKQVVADAGGEQAGKDYQGARLREWHALVLRKLRRMVEGRTGGKL